MQFLMVHNYTFVTHPGSKSKILDIRILNPQKMKKVYPPWPFFLFTFIRGIFALYESLGQNINDTICKIVKNNFLDPPSTLQKIFFFHIFLKKCVPIKKLAFCKMTLFPFGYRIQLQLELDI